MPRAIVAVVLALALLGLGWIFFGPKGKNLDPAQGGGLGKPLPSGDLGAFQLQAHPVGPGHAEGAL